MAPHVCAGELYRLRRRFGNGWGILKCMASSRPSGHLSGGKFTASHTTVIEAADAPARAAAQLACVSKVSLGLIKTLRNGPPALKFLDEGPACLLAKVRGIRSLQEIRVYTSDKEATKAAMSAVFVGR